MSKKLEREIEETVEEVVETVTGRRRGMKKGRVGLWKAFWGLLFLAAAAAVIVSMFGIVDFGLNIAWVVFAIFLAAATISSLIKLQWWGVFLPVAGILTIGITQTDHLDFMGDGVIWPIWITAGLLSVGFSILFHKSGRNMGNIISMGWDDGGEIIDQEDGEKVEIDMTMGETIKYVNSDDFKKATVRCKLGGVKVYFDNAKIKGKSATIGIRGTMCGIELFVPKDWDIVNNVNCTMADIEEKNSRTRVDAKNVKTVHLKGNLTMAGVEIIYI